MPWSRPSAAAAAALGRAGRTGGCRMNLFLDGIAWILDPANWTGVGSIPERIGQHLRDLGDRARDRLAHRPARRRGSSGHTGRGKELAGDGLRRAPGAARRSACSPCSRSGSASACRRRHRPRHPRASRRCSPAPTRASSPSTGAPSTPPGRWACARARSSARSSSRSACRSSSAASARRRCRSSRRRPSPRTSPTSGSAGSSSPGLKTRDYAEMLGGSILVIILALVVDGCFALTQRLVVPAGVRAARAAELRSGPTRPRAAMGRPINEGNPE